LLVDQPTFDPTGTTPPPVFPFFPQADKAQWGGADDNAWVRAGSASSSRLGLDDLRGPTSTQFAGQSAPSRVARSDNLAAGVSLVGGGVGTSESRLEFQGLHGDRFPHGISAGGGVQFSRAAGGLEAASRGTGPGSARTEDNQSFNVSLTEAGNIARAVANGRGNVAGDSQKSGMTANQGSDMPQLGFGGDVGT